MSFEPFALWQAERERPELRALPVVVEASKRVGYVSQAARDAGVERGMTLAAARQCSPELRVLPAASAHLDASWESLLGDLHGLSPWLESLAQGRALLRVPASEAAELARHYQARLGLSPYRELALVAALAARPGSVQHVAEGSEDAFLARLPLHFARGLGLSARSVERLQYLGVTVFADLREWRASQLRAFLGAEASTLLPVVLGPWQRDIRRYSPPDSLACRHDFEEPASEPAQLEPVLRHLSGELAARLGGRSASRLSVLVRAAGLQFSSSRVAKAPITSVRRVEQLASLALADTEAQSLGVESVTLRLSGLERPAVQGELWRSREQRQKAIDMVSSRFPDALLYFELRNPFSHAREERYCLCVLRSNRPAETEVRREAQAPDARGAGRRTGDAAARLVPEQPA